MSDLVRTCARLTTGRRVVVALSGGRDSVVLLDALVRARADVRAAHVDHGLRTDSGDDAAFCADLAANHGIPFASTMVAVRRGNSTQGRARIQRYAALVRLCSELGGDTLAVAHHADDAWESTLLQQQRGAGVVGAAGPRVWSDWCGTPVLRPLLDYRSADLAAHAAQFGLIWREDPSNASASYARNRLRHDGAGFDEAELHRLKAARDELVARADAVPHDRPGPLQVRLTPGDSKPDALSQALLDHARELHGELPRDVVEEVVAAISERRRGRFCGRRVIATVTGNGVELAASRGQGTRLTDARSAVPVDLSLGRLPWFGGHLVVGKDRSDGGGIALRTLDSVTLRGATTSDRISSAGFDGSQRVYDLLAAAGVPRHRRWTWPCVFGEERCLWVCKIRAAEPDSAFLLPRGAVSGIFVQWDPFHPTVSATKVVVAER